MSMNWKRGHIVSFSPNSISALWILKCMSGHAFRWCIKRAVALFMLKGVHKYPQLAACTLPSSHREHCMVWGSSLSITSLICITISLILMALAITWHYCPISFCLKVLILSVCGWRDGKQGSASELCVSVGLFQLLLLLLLLTACVCTCVNCSPLEKVVESQWLISSEWVF